jgi:TetR/AcrR family transcriptional regulator
MPRGRSAGYELQQDSILQHAAELFATRGFQGTSMQDLAAAAGVSKALLYHYYQDKYRLLVAIAEGHIDRLVALVGAADDASDPLAALIARFVTEYASARAHHQVLVQDIKYLEANDQARIREKERKVVSAFAKAIAIAHPRLGERQLEKPLAMLLFGMINWLFTWFRDDGSLDYTGLSALVTAFVEGGLGAAAVTGRAAPDVH